MSRAVLRRLDERFAAWEDWVSEFLGRWPISLAAICGVIFWMVSGPAHSFSDGWQLSINTPTTLVELFTGFFTLGAANRFERQLNKRIDEVSERLDILLARRKLPAIVRTTNGTLWYVSVTGAVTKLHPAEEG